MNIHVWRDGSWCYDRELVETLAFKDGQYSTINLDKLYSYPNLTDREIDAINEALGD